MLSPDYVRPANLNDALQALASREFQVLAGGTDVFPACSDRPAAISMLDITGVPDLAGITVEEDRWRIGATTTWSTLVRSQLPPQLHGLQAAAREVGGVQIQNAGTLAGNICNASPAADGIPALLALDAEVELSSLHGTRYLLLSDFLLGSRKTARRSDELLTAIVIPHRPAARSAFLKLGHRRYLVISIVMVSAVLEVEHGVIVHAALAVGSCSAVARRLHALEKKLIGQPASLAVMNHIHEDDLAGLSPIQDIRGTAGYRMDAALTLVRRAVTEAMHEQAA
ncbi:MAG: xanthine dehydrogenase family protein subunit M [Oxalobacteraceae bacterium]|jgi:CO/xanthine dehydrogenase FAD-binding subunit|nr:xanthine dehydrogenase family protein subunit M [Oxalobacteraceae bacterium]